MTAPAGRWVRVVVLVMLAASTLVVWQRLYDLSQSRYFTVDEYQFGHAAWLVSEGRVPYVDFYEHHLPASYVLHAPLVAGDSPFEARALRLRGAAFAWLLLVSLGLGAATLRVLSDPFAALLAAQLPLVFGFSALSLVDFRADNLAGLAFIGCLLALESNRRSARLGLSVLAGLLLALAVLSTQKLLLLGVAPVAAMLALDFWRRNREAVLPFVRRPVAFCAAAAGLVGVALLVAGAFGMWEPGFEATVRHAIEHEALYPETRLAPYALPFLAETGFSTWPLLLFAVLGLATRQGRIFILPLVAAVLAGFWMRGKFPYNFVVPCLLACLLAVRGHASGVAWFSARGPRARAMAPLLYLAPLLVIPDQLSFAEGRTSNAHQLHVLAKIERFTQRGDAVIDDAGGALFREHASHYYYHGPAHRAVLADYFENELLRDYRESQALFWIRDFRLKKLPTEVRDYFRDHYVRADGWLYALGVVTAASGDAPTRRELDIIRPGTYYAYPAPGGVVADRGVAAGVTIDGVAVGEQGVRLEPGMHPLVVSADAPPVLVTPLPRAAFQDRFPRMRPYAMLFEYARKPSRAWRERTLLTP